MFGKKKSGGFMDQIRCDEPSYLIWKWRPAGSKLKEKERENAIRWGSSLRVKDGEVAVFVYNQANNITQEYIEGPCDIILNTSNLPVLANILGLLYENGTPFQAEIFFINLAQLIQIKFGVPFFDVYDPRFPDFEVPLAVRGSINFRIQNYQRFIKLHRLQQFDPHDFQKQIKDVVNRYVKHIVMNIPSMYQLPVVQMESKIAQINELLEYDLKDRLNQEFGVHVSSVDISAIEIDKSSPGYKQLMKITKEITTAKMNAETTDYTERLRIQREEGQYAQHLQTQSAHFNAFQVGKQAEVGIEAARSLGRMNTTLSNSQQQCEDQDGLNIVGLMMGMTLGQNIAGTMNNMLNGMNQQAQTNTPSPIPPVPKTSYYVAINGQPMGPFDISTLTQMAANNQLSSQSLVWKPGMTEWCKAEKLEDLQSLFVTIPPLPPIDQ